MDTGPLTIDSVFGTRSRSSRVAESRLNAVSGKKRRPLESSDTYPHIVSMLSSGTRGSAASGATNFISEIRQLSFDTADQRQPGCWHYPRGLELTHEPRAQTRNLSRHRAWRARACLRDFTACDRLSARCPTGRCDVFGISGIPGPKE